jgi:hypothetical protein
MPKPVDVVIRKNMFAALYISDSDSEEADVREDEGVGDKVDSLAATATASADKEPAEEKLESGGESLQQENSYRRWVRPDNGRFASDSSENIFSSPFYKGKRTLSKHWTRPRFVEDNDGWVSIRHGNFEETEKDSGVVYEERTVKEVTEPSTEVSEELSASIWAERIKNTLEKAEQTRTSKSIDEEFKVSLQRLSFFRRPISI